MLVNFFFILLLIGLALGIISSLIDIISRIKIMLSFKKNKGKFVVGKFIENEKGEKTKEIYYCVDIRKNGYSSTPDVRKALFFNDQCEALEAIRKCCFEGLFVIKL